MINRKVDAAYTFFDVETPNRHNDRPCSIGIVQTDDSGSIIRTESFFINPEEIFDDFCIGIHHITPLDVSDAPTFDELWETTLANLFLGTTAVAHNASFDMRVMAKSLAHYGLNDPHLTYADTLRMSRYVYPNLESYKLSSICDFLGVELETAHNASSDAMACCGVFWKLAPQIEHFDYMIQPYYIDIRKLKRENNSKKPALSEKTRNARELKDELEEVIGDGEVSVDEAQNVLDLIESHESFGQNATIRRISDKLQEAMLDGFVTKEESNELVSLMENFVNPHMESTDNIVYEGKLFCLSGTFMRGQKKDIEKIIQERGGSINGSVTKKVDYLVVGGCGNENWTMGNYGSKVEKAMQLQAKGDDIVIVGEDALFQDKNKD